MEIQNFGRVYLEDPRDNMFPVSDILPKSVPNVNSKDWWDDGWRGDQRNTSQCVAFSWCHWLEDGPVVHMSLPRPRQVPMLTPARFYHECQLRDGIPGTRYEGTTVRAGAKVLKELNLIREYRWTRSVEELTKALTFVGPAVVGTEWFANMTNLNRDNICRLGGRSQGGHAYVINAFDRHRQLFRIKNSWGTRWGVNGSAFISFNDMQTLLNGRGEACIAIPIEAQVLPDLSSLSEARDVV